MLISECSKHDLAWSKISEFFICPVRSEISNILLVLVQFDRPLENLENALSFFEVSDSGSGFLKDLDPGPKRSLVSRKLTILNDPLVPFGSYRPVFLHET